MLKEILLALSLISLSSSDTVIPVTYAPWHLRNFDYSISDICSYSYNTFKYVKPCQANYMCQSVGGDSHGIETCRQMYKTVKIYGEACSGDIECDSGLECKGSICVNLNDGSIYDIDDRISDDHVYKCNSNQRPSFDYVNQRFVCSSNSDPIFEGMNNLCYKYDGTNQKKIPPSFNKVCGEDSFPLSGNYISQTSMTTIGSLDDGTFVTDERACSSGFALYLYRSKTLVKPGNTEDQNMYKVCVTLKEIASDNGGNKVFKYSIGTTENVYNVANLPSDTNYPYPTDSHLMTKLELFKEFVDKAKSVTCQENQGYDDEQFTCKNDELRRLWYFYHHVEEYLLYKNEDAIVDYLVEQTYPEYSPRYAEPQQEASSFLNVKFISLLILLLSL